MSESGPGERYNPDRELRKELEEQQVRIKEQAERIIQGGKSGDTSQTQPDKSGQTTEPKTPSTSR